MTLRGEVFGLNEETDGPCKMHKVPIKLASLEDESDRLGLKTTWWS